jgi:fructan beta-fructosidase
MVYYKGIYHLFFQFYPGASVWGPMHWGHATSADLVHWKEEPIALYPDSLGYIFSGSAIIDKDNTSQLGTQGKIPMVAIYTNHDPHGEKAKTTTFQNQSIAYSLDSGKTWTKYSGNPVLKNPGIRDFRDPKVIYYEPGKKWIMTLATQDHISFFSSPNLKNWSKESEFGKIQGAHGGVWECPDLFPLKYGDKEYWILIVNMNPGGPNGGSATQYFMGSFDGHSFIPLDEKIRWLDFGPDEYAGITWSGTGERRIFLGWMSNWNYAGLVPTSSWRGAMTLPRDLAIIESYGTYFLGSIPVKELNSLESNSIELGKSMVSDSLVFPLFPGKQAIPCRIDMDLIQAQDFSFEISNAIGEKVLIGFDQSKNTFVFDRRNSGQVNFQKDFPTLSTMKRKLPSGALDFSLILDQSSMELFSDHGLGVMTGIFFPKEPYTQIKLRLKDPKNIRKLRYASYKSIWE